MLKEVSNSISCCYCGVRFKGGSLSLEAVSVGYGWRTSLLSNSSCSHWLESYVFLNVLCSVLGALLGSAWDSRPSLAAWDQSSFRLVKDKRVFGSEGLL